MAASRLRLRLAAGFALAFAGGLALLAAGALGYLWRESNRRLDMRLDAVAVGVSAALAREAHETPDSSLRFVALEVAAEWPSSGDAFLVLDASGNSLAIADHHGAAQRVFRAWQAHPADRLDVDQGGPDFRVRVINTVLGLSAGRRMPVKILAFASTEGIESDTEMLGLSLAIAAPLIILVSLVAGYFMAGRAMAPVTCLTRNIAQIAPSDLSRRLDVTRSGDEVSQLASEFNALLARLEEAQARNRGFVREAAHQIRTPLTLVLGEAAHELEAGEPSASRMRATLGRIRTAAEQMRRRVDELFLRAEAIAGEPVPLDDTVELDGLLLECTDLMRARATTLGRALAIERADPIAVRGNEALLREAFLELLENACRHGSNDGAVAISCTRAHGRAIVEVTSQGPAFELPPSTEARGRSGLGLPIVRWVAESHHGVLELHRDATSNRVRIILPDV